MFPLPLAPSREGRGNFAVSFFARRAQIAPIHLRRPDCTKLLGLGSPPPAVGEGQGGGEAGLTQLTTEY
jgi:hypothetical protein